MPFDQPLNGGIAVDVRLREVWEVEFLWFLVTSARQFNVYWAARNPSEERLVRIFDEMRGHLGVNYGYCVVPNA